MTKYLNDIDFEAAVCRMYVEGVTVSRICGTHGLALSRLYAILDRAPDGPIPRRRSGSASQGAPSAGAAALAAARADEASDPAVAAADPSVEAAYRAQVLRRLWRAADRQVRDIGRRLGASGEAMTDRERDARALATLARVVRELATVDAVARREADATAEAQAAARQATAMEDADDIDAPPRDPELFRAALAQRIDQLRETGSAAPRPGDAERG